MTSKQRVHAALERLPVDRVPVFMWFHPDTARHLANLLEIPASEVGEAMGNDVAQTWVNNNYAMKGIVHELEGEWHRDFWGIKWVKPGLSTSQPSSPFPEPPNRSCWPIAFPRTRWTSCWPAWLPSSNAARSCSWAATFPPAPSRCTGACGAWRRPCWTSRPARRWPPAPMDLILKAEPRKIREEARRCIAVAGERDGGYILAPSGAFIPGTPVENIRALVEAAEQD